MPASYGLRTDTLPCTVCSAFECLCYDAGEATSAEGHIGPEWSRRRITLVADLDRAQDIAEEWEADAGWHVIQLVTGEPCQGHATTVVEVAVPQPVATDR